MKEVYKNILELDNHFQVSNFGNIFKKERKVKSSVQSSGFRTIKARKPALQDNGRGYLQIYAKVNNKRTVLYVHRLVAKYFIDNPEGKPEVNHIDGDKSNNHFLNLEWNTRKQNQEHASKKGLIPRGSSSVLSKLNESQVKAIKRLFRINPNFNKSKVAKKLNIQDTAIHKIIKGINWKHIKI